MPHGIVEPVDSRIHVLHQERVDEVGKLWTEEPLGGTLRCDATADQQSGENRVDAQLFSQFGGGMLLFSSGWRVVPFEIHFQLFLFLSVKVQKKSQR